MFKNGRVRILSGDITDAGSLKAAEKYQNKYQSAFQSADFELVLAVVTGFLTLGN